MGETLTVFYLTQYILNITDIITDIIIKLFMRYFPSFDTKSSKSSLYMPLIAHLNSHAHF